MVEKVAVVQVDGNLTAALRSAVDLIGGITVDKGQKIVIKPNLSDLVSSEKGVTTSPDLVEQLILYIREKASAEISIVESDHWVATADEEFDMLGYNELREKYGVKLVNISRDKKIKVLIDGFYLNALDVPETLLKSDMFISVAKLKTHSAEKISCILKNQFGLITKRYKNEYHPYMSKVLADLNCFYKPDLCIVDGLVSMEGAGPTFGEPKKTGLIICGKDPVAVDLVAAEIMGFKPDKVPHLKFAMHHNIGGVCKLNDVEIVGEKLENIKVKFNFIPFSNYFLARFSFLCIRLINFLSRVLINSTRSIMVINNVKRNNLRQILIYAYNLIWTKVAQVLTKIRYSMLT